MRFQCLVCLLLASLTYGQVPPPATPAPVTPMAAPSSANAAPNAAPAPEQTPEVKVAPEEAVITLKGFCSDAALQGDACKTLITRAQFEKLAEALQPKMSPVIRRNLANAYARMLRMSTEAEKRGLEKQPKFEEMLMFARMQLLAQELSRSLQEDAGKISDADMEEYYKKNVGSYEQATLARIFVPRAKQLVTPVAPKTITKAGTTTPKAAAPQPPTEAQKKASEEAMKKVAESLQARAAKGEDPDKLQKEAYVAAGLPGNAPSTKMEKVRRATLPVNHHQVMDLKPGEVSELIVDTNSGFYIYKMISKETQPMDTVKPDIRNQISSERYRTSMQNYQGNVDLNDAYFGPGPGRNPAGPPHPKGVPTPGQDAEDND